MLGSLTLSGAERPAFVTWGAAVKPGILEGIVPSEFGVPERNRILLHACRVGPQGGVSCATMHPKPEDVIGCLLVRVLKQLWEAESQDKWRVGLVKTNTVARWWLRTFAVAAALVAIATSAWAEDVLCRTTKGKIESRDDVCKAGETVVDVREADEKMVASCTFLGDVTASSSFGGLAQGKGQARARRSAVKRAAEKNATHIVWSNLSSGWGGGNASGRAYKCEPAAPGQGNDK